MKRDYESIRVPVLALFTAPSSPSDVTAGAYQPKDDQEWTAMDEVYVAVLNEINTDKKSLQSGLPSARVIDVPGANHFIFLSNEADVLRELRAFLAGLH